MKKTELRKIIKEEIENVLNESTSDNFKINGVIYNIFASQDHKIIATTLANALKKSGFFEKYQLFSIKVEVK